MFEDDVYLQYNQRWALKKGKEETFDEVWKSPLLADNEIKMKDSILVMLKGPEITESSIYQCLKCKSRRIKVTVSQTRAADEESSVSYECTSCGNKWGMR